MSVQTKSKVIIAMSGGVDSSVCGLLMQKEGYECIGMTMRLWSGKEKGSEKTCCGSQSVEDARLVAEKIGFPFYAINFQKDFWKEVIEVFADEYFKGRTPSPCILCNEKMKFDSLYHKALSIGAEKVCTGHYARIEYNEEMGRWHLRKGVDIRKDQSYFLFSMTQEQLAKTIFPLGGYTKPEIREMALEAGLITAKKAESQDICFIPNNDYASFLKKHFPDRIPEKGPIKSTEGKVLGEHTGIHSVTVGQRRGLGVAFGQPLYVTAIDANKNEVTVGERNKTHATSFTIKKATWVYQIPKLGEKYKLLIKIRARSKEVPGTVTPLEGGRAEVVFDEPQHAITPGQASVFYIDDYVFGGGWIE
ncbi:MAG: tRNA-specific 2-thiouridylase MnmA [Chlamydiae bacterium]|nr:tRNA-specific 2-thiouridylase MnmA [Chlamydiota bacterium]